MHIVSILFVKRTRLLPGRGGEIYNYRIDQVGEKIKMPIELLITFDSTVAGGYFVHHHIIDQDMIYREVYKQKSSYVFDGKKYKVFVLFRSGNIAPRKPVLDFVTRYLERNL